MLIEDIKIVQEILEREDIVAIPTETVYGLAANIFSEKAIKKIFELKKRPFFNPLIVHIKSIDYLTQIADDIPLDAMKLAETFWPGPLTLVLKKKSEISDLITGGKKTVGIRVPNHKLTLRLLQNLDFPLAAPSANTFQSISPTLPEHVVKNFGQNLAILDGGPCKLGLESTIVGFKNGETIIYRLGAISVEEIENIVGTVHIQNDENNKPIAPGMMEKHYSPDTPIIATDNLNTTISNSTGNKIGVLCINIPQGNQEIEHLEILSKTRNLEEAASNFYSALHKLDNQKLDLIIAERFPDKGLGKTMNDRLSRAIKQFKNNPK